MDLKGTTVDLSEGGLRAAFDGYGAPPEAGATFVATVSLGRVFEDESRGGAYAGPQAAGG